jgi:hypothetical protein
MVAPPAHGAGDEVRQLGRNDPTPLALLSAANRPHRILRGLTAELGRDPHTIDRIYLIGNTDAKPLRSLAAFEDFVGRYDELGFTDVVFHMPRPDDPVWDESPEIVDEIAARSSPADPRTAVRQRSATQPVTEL